jgi:hypothetical protein
MRFIWKLDHLLVFTQNQLNKFYLNKAFIDNLQRFLRSVSGTGWHRELPVPAPTGPDRPSQDRSGYFYDVFDTHFVLNRPKRYDI